MERPHRAQLRSEAPHRGRQSARRSPPASEQSSVPPVRRRRCRRRPRSCSRAGRFRPSVINALPRGSRQAMLAPGRRCADTVAAVSRARTKQVCTIGPASIELVPQLVAAGMDVARINFSHGTPDDHREYVHAVRAAAHSARRSVAVMADLPGPKLRLGDTRGRSAAARDRRRVRAAGRRRHAGDAQSAAVLRTGRLLAGCRPAIACCSPTAPPSCASSRRWSEHGAHRGRQRRPDPHALRA